MKILNAEQVHALDAHTIEHEPIASLDLMERASTRFCSWFCRQFPDRQRPVFLAAGIGNNGGDAFAVARLLHGEGYPVEVVWCRLGDSASPDCQANRERLRPLSAVPVTELRAGEPFPSPPEGAVVVDGVFGSGLNRPVEGYWAEWLQHLNALPVTRVAIDIPSGVFADQLSSSASFRAHHTISFQLPKRAFLAPENAERVGRWEVVDIGLDEAFLQTLETPYHYLDAAAARGLLRPRGAFDHKGTYGHALLIAGSLGSMGAATLTARGCYRSGAGLVTVHVPGCGYAILQNSVPEAMVSVDPNETCFTQAPDAERYAAIGIGPGLGQSTSSARALRELLERQGRPMVLDADALNLMAREPDLLRHIPPNSVLTPHPKEFERLFGPTPDSFAAVERQREKARELQCVITIKRAYTSVAWPDGTCFFNSTGNPGMGTGGSGDVLTGILTGLLAQGYDPGAAACLGVYLHGLAGDLAATAGSEEALLAGDLPGFLGPAYRQLRGPSR